MSSVNLPFKMPMFSTYHNIGGAGVTYIMEVIILKKLLKKRIKRSNVKVALYAGETTINVNCPC